MNPLLLMALLTAGSTAANYQGQRKVNAARQRALAEESARRGEAEKRNAASAKSTADLFANAGTDQDKKAAEMEKAYADAHTAAPQPLTPQLADVMAPAGATTTVNTPDILGGRVRAEAANRAKQRSILESYGEVMGENKIAAQRNAQDIEQQNSGVRNWNQAVLPAQLEAANQAGRSWNTLGDVIQLAGALYGPLGLSKGAGTAAAASGGAAAVPGKVRGLKNLFTADMGNIVY